MDVLKVVYLVVMKAVHLVALMEYNLVYQKVVMKVEYLGD